MKPEILFKDYFDTFVQPTPRYAVKSKNGWHSRKKNVCDKVIQAHLDQKYTVGVLGRWYPEYAILDMDDVAPKKVDDIRSQLSLDETNSMLCSSESLDSYHLLIKPAYKGKPPTLKTLQNTLGPFVKQNEIELYPQKNRVIRLPFGKNQNCLDDVYAGLKTWKEMGYWFHKLDDFELGSVKDQQAELDLKFPKATLEPCNFYSEGKELMEQGLQRPSSRHEAQFKIIYYLWRNNVSQDETQRSIWYWINNRHNGFSKDIVKYPKQVKSEIIFQTQHVYSKYDRAFVYPDKTHNNFNGYITKPDLEDIIELCDASMPRMRFLFNAIKYAYPRRYRSFINVHTDNLIQWGSSRTYQKYLNEFDERGILKRGGSYLSGKFSKSLSYNWNFKQDSKAVLYQGRAIETFEDTVKLLFMQQDFKDLLSKAGAQKRNRNKIVRAIYSGIRWEQMHKHI